MGGAGVEMEAEMSVTQPPAKGGLEPPEAGRNTKDPPLGPSEGPESCRHLDFRLVDSTQSDNNLCCFKPPGLRSFGTAAEVTNTSLHYGLNRDRDFKRSTWPLSPLGGHCGGLGVDGG